MTQNAKKNVVVVGASGGIGRAFVDLLCAIDDVETVHACARTSVRQDHNKVKCHHLDYADESTIESVFDTITNPIDIVIVATGLLHNDSMQPEKTIKSMAADHAWQVYLVNVIGPSLIMKYALPKMNKNGNAVFAALSARVGSISDNRLGGWYNYRASKAALNMMIKSASIEMARTHPNMAIIGLHPGTVDTGLSKPFQGYVSDAQLFTPEYSATQMLQIINECQSTQTGKIFDYAGDEIQP